METVIFSTVITVLGVTIFLFWSYRKFQMKQTKECTYIAHGGYLLCLLIFYFFMIIINIYHFSLIRKNTQIETKRNYQGMPITNLIDGKTYKLIKFVEGPNTSSDYIKVILEDGSLLSRYFSIENSKLRKPNREIPLIEEAFPKQFITQKHIFLGSNPDKEGEFKKTEGWILHSLKTLPKDD